MSPGWAGPAWGEPSAATRSPVPLRPLVSAADAGYRADGGFTGRFAVLGASVVGVSHRLAGRRCDDAFGWALLSPDLVVLVVADGVSGAARGGEGAELAVGAACRNAVERAERKAADNAGGPSPGGGAWAPGGREWGLVLCLGATMAANETLFAAAEEVGCDRGDFATTLLVAAVTCGDGAAHVDIARLGDSTAFVLDGTHWEEIVPDRPDGAEDEVIELTVGAVLPGAEVDAVGGIQVSSLDLSVDQALVLVTDGMANPLRDGPATVAPALADVLARGPAGQLSPWELAQAADFSRRGCRDDRTVLAAWPLGQG